MGLRGWRARQPQDAALLSRMGFQAGFVRVLQGVVLIKVELVVRTGRQDFAQRAVGGERDVVEQVRKPELLGFLGLGIQDGLRGGRYQKGLAGHPVGELAGSQQAVHFAQADESFAQAHRQGDAG
jgi:hypothetical protein